MKFILHSDTHYEIDNTRSYISDKPKVCDVVLLAGDITAGDSLVETMERYRDAYYAPVVAVPGNHEYYGQCWSLLDQQIREKVESKPHLHFLNNDTIFLNGVRIIGSSLWTGFDVFGEGEKWFAKQNAKDVMADYKMIFKEDGSRLRPDDTETFHHRCVDYLKHVLSIPFDGKTVVMTHHAPLPECERPQYRNNLTSAAFVNRLYDLVTYKDIDLWVFGHTHFNIDFNACETRFLTNQAGYSFERSDFQPDAVFEV